MEYETNAHEGLSNPMIGRTISEYRILGKLGEGGMGTVFKAMDLKLQHEVALKFISRDLTREPEAKERFLQEARAAFALDHPNICTVHGIGETEEGQMFIVMALYEGETLRQRLSREKPGDDEVRSIVAQIARGLAKAHKDGVVHRDIKPANIMITNDGVVKILDFGLAKLANETILTRPGSTFGTVAYMSPEQARGEPVGELSDIWSLGAVLYELLTGQVPFKGEYPQVVIYSLLNLEPVDVWKLRKGAPEDLRALCHRCLQKNMGERPRNMTEVLHMLGATSTGAVPDLLFPIQKLFPFSRIAFASALIALILILWKVVPLFTSGESEKSLLAILPFRNLTGEAEVNQWLPSLQSMVEHDFKHLGVYAYDINSLNGYLASSFGALDARPDEEGNKVLKSRGVRFLVDGNIGKSDSGYTLQMEVQDLVEPGFDQTQPVVFKGSTAVADAIVSLIPQISGFLHLKQLSPEKAKDLEPWISRRPQSMEAHLALMEASSYIYRGERGGEKFLLRAVELDSMFFTPRIWLISSLVSRRRTGESMPHYEFLRRHEKEADGFDQAMIDWCWAYIQQDEAGQVRHLRTALEYSPGNNILLYNIARLTYLEKDWTGTIQLLKPVVDMKWGYSPAYFFIGSSYLRLGNHVEARRVLEQSLKVAPSAWPDIYGMLATLALRRGDTSEALSYDEKFLSRAQLRGDSSWEAHANLGSIYAEEGLPSHAIRYYTAAVNERAEKAEYHDSLAVLLYRKGEFDLALKECKEVQKLDASLLDPYYFEGRILESRHDTVGALAGYRNYLIKDSTSTRAQEIKQRVSTLGH